MTEIFSLFGQSDSQGPPGSSALGYGPGKQPGPPPQNQVSMAVQMPPQLGDEGPPLRKPAAMNEPFYLLRELPVGNELTGNTNLITHYNLEHAYNKFCGKKLKEKLSNFLPELPGKTWLGLHHSCCLACPFLCLSALGSGRETLRTSPCAQHPPSVMAENWSISVHVGEERRITDESNLSIPHLFPETPSDSDHKKKKKKRDDDPDRKKKKKDKKKKKNRHSPDHPGLAGSQPNSSNSLR
nr:PREDICTED: mediator of RNA polymerase II transcription subunit 19 [Lepisosteus oculatus]